MCIIFRHINYDITLDTAVYNKRKIPTEASYITEDYKILADSEREWNNIIMQKILSEAAYIVTGRNEILLEADESFLTKVVNFFKKLFEKIKEVCSSFVTWVKTCVANDTKFLEKYGDRINKLENKLPKNWSYPLTPYNVNTMKRIISDGLSSCDTAINNKIREFEEHHEIKDSTKNYSNEQKAGAKEENDDKNDSEQEEKAIYRKFFITKGGNITDEADFKEELQMAFCDGDSPDKEHKDKNEINWDELKEVVKNYEKSLDLLTATQSKVSSLYNKIINALSVNKRRFESTTKDNPVTVKKVTQITSNVNDFKYKSKQKNKDNNDEGKSDNNIEYKIEDKNSTADTDEKKEQEHKNYKANTAQKMEKSINSCRYILNTANTALSTALDCLKIRHSEARGCLNKAIVKTSKSF